MQNAAEGILVDSEIERSMTNNASSGVAGHVEHAYFSLWKLNPLSSACGSTNMESAVLHAQMEVLARQTGLGISLPTVGRSTCLSPSTATA
ncbi:MAG: hypothetical protein QOF62_3387 [Pyrinomonadaceae bacterium]|jgi:hypothetical protein|nr:hypothetical protein [Pyrinomonadaceae bacterium]